MKRKLPVIFSGIIGALIIAIIAFGFVLHNKNEKINNLEKVKAEKALNTNIGLNANSNSGEKIAGIDFKNVNVEISKNGNDEVVNLQYTLEGKGQKQQNLKNVKLENQKGKWVVSSGQKLTSSQTQVVEKLANSQGNIDKNIQETVTKENEVAQNIQNEMNQQFAAMNKQFEQMNKQFNQVFKNN